MSVKCADLIQRYPEFFTELIGPSDAQFSRVASPETARAGDAVFLATPKAFAEGIKSQASVLVINKKFLEAAKKEAPGRTLLLATNTELAMAKVINDHFRETPYRSSSLKGTHPTAIVAASAKVAKSATIGPFAFIGENVEIGESTYIGASSVIEDRATIGESTVVHPHVFVGHGCQIGSKVEIHPSTVVGKEGLGYAHHAKGNHYRIPHQGIVVIEDDVHIGSHCTIDRATFGETRIGRGSKFDNRVHIAHNVKIGQNAMITAGFVAAGSAEIGNNFLCGGNTSVNGHIKVGDGIQVAALTAIRKPPPGPGAYGGNPLEPLQSNLKTMNTIPHISKMRKQIAMIMKHLGISEPEKAD